MRRVCHISTMTNIGGVEKIIIDYLSLNKADSSYEHILLCPSYKNEVIRPLEGVNVRMYFPKRLFKFDPISIYRMWRWIERNDIHILHSYNSLANNVGNILAFLSGLPLVCSEHGTVWKAKGIRKVLDKLAYNRATKITANSMASKHMLAVNYSILESSIIILNNPVPIVYLNIDKRSLRSEFGLSDDISIVGTIARLVPLKGLDIFIKAAHKVLEQDSKFVFIIVGGGSEEIYLKLLNRQFNTSDRVIFTGWREDARRILKIFDIYVSTSVRESFGNVFIEAGFEGIPVIAPNVDGIAEAVLDDVTGKLIDPSEPLVFREGMPTVSVVNGELRKPKTLDYSLLALEILKLRNSPDQMKEFGVAGRKHATQFTLKKYTKALEKIYNSIQF